MKTIEYTSEVADRIGDITVGNFSIEANAKAFKILSSQIYSDNITPPIRELATNAWDSHVEAIKRGNDPKRPFEVHLPTVIEPWFSVRDFGVGMSEEEINTIYTSYFKSTKTESNDYVGCLGLGSKSPFTYSDTFTVSSYQNGRMLIYTAFLENGVPKHAKLGDEKTNEPDGMLIQFSVNDADISKFVSHAQAIYNRFINRPKILNCPEFKYTEVNHDYKGNGWAIQEAKTRKGSFAIMGNIAYPIKPENLNVDSYRGSADDKHISALVQCGVDLIFPIGQLEIAASRETLHFDDRTIKNIKDRCKIVLNELQATINQKFDKCKSKWEALCLHDELFHSNDIFDYSLKQILSMNDYFYSDSKIHTSRFTFYDVTGNNMSETWKFFYGSSHNRFGGNLKPRKKKAHDIRVNTHVKFAKNDLAVGGMSRLSYYTQNNNKEIVYLLPADAAVANKILKFFEYDEKNVIKTSQLPKAVIKRSSAIGGNKKSRTVQQLCGFFIWSPRTNWRDVVIDDITTGTYFYLVTQNSLPNNKTGRTLDMADLDRIIKLLSGKGLFDITKTPIYGIRSFQSTRIERLDNWVNFNDFVAEKLLGLFNIDKLSQSIVDTTHFNQHKNICVKFEQFIKLYKLNRCDSLTYVNQTVSIFENWKKSLTEILAELKIYDYYKIITGCELITNTSTPSIDVEQTVSNFYKKYPMLKYVEVEPTIDVNVDIIEYIKKTENS